MKKTSFFCRAGFRKEQALSKIAVQPFDLMSRRHPLSSTRAAGLKFASWKQTALTALVTSPASTRRQFFKGELTSSSSCRPSSQSSSLRSSPSLPS
jgi:hypothetical protein